MSKYTKHIKAWDKMSKKHVYGNIYEIVRLLNNKKNITVIDVGANSGTLFDVLCENFEIDRAILFEPQPLLFKYLKKKYKDNYKVTVENFALSDCVKNFNLDDRQFKIELNNYVKDNELYNLGLSSIDCVENGELETTSFDLIRKKYKLDKIDLIKIDTETEDLLVLKGFTETIKELNEKPLITFECNWWVKYTFDESKKIFDDFCNTNNYENNIDLNQRGDFYINPKMTSKVMKNLNLSNNNITIVTGLWDLKRGDLRGWAKRDFKQYKERFFELLQTDAQMCIWIPKSLEKEVLDIRGDKPTRIIIKEIEDFKTWNPFFDKIQEIRNNPEWKNLAGWLSDSPQAALEFYNPMMFTKFFMLNDTALSNPFGSDYFFWIDGGLTSTVSSGYFINDKVLDNLENYVLSHDDKFIQISYPYTGGDEIHGFERKAIARYCGTDHVNYVCRGGFFGGSKENIHDLNNYYYSVMYDTLNEGLMGADECLFTILAHKYQDSIYRYEVNADGLIWSFFENLKTYTKPIYKDNKIPPNISNVSLYVITFNSPKQFEALINSMIEYDDNFIKKPKKYLLNNSTDLTTTEEYQCLCDKYCFEHIKKDNIGIVGGRVFVADHFHNSSSDYYFWFEDDMSFCSKDDLFCKNGFTRQIPDLYNKTLEIIKKENYDFIKLNFTEFFGDNSVQWSWYNTPDSFKRSHWGKLKVPPLTKFQNIKSHKNLPYADGEIFLCNWVSIFNREGNYKCYIDVKWDHPFEQTLMSHAYQETVKGKIKPGILLATPTEHNRFEFYPKELRREN